MGKLVSLLKATMSEGMQLFNYRSNRERSGRAVPFLLATLVGVGMLFSATVLTAALKEDGEEAAVLSMYTLVTVIVILMEGIYKSSDLLFNPRDNDTLLAMPIKKSTIVLARMLKFYTFELLYCFIFLLPAMIAYVINVEVSASFFLVALTMLLFVPIIPIAISCVVGLIISAISSKFNKHRTILQVILSFIALVVFAIFILKFNTMSGANGRFMIAISNKMTEFYYPASTFVGLATHFDWGQYLLFVAINLAVLVATVYLISKFYFRIVTRMKTVKRFGNMGTDYKFAKHSQTFAIVKKELTKYFSTPVLMMNTAIGLVIFLVAVIALCFKFDDIVASLTASIEDFPLTGEEVHAFLPSVIFICVAFASLMTFITATMISLEGKAFNLLKSMPISGKKVIMAKVLAAMLLIVPVTAVGCLIAFVRFRFGLLEMVLVLIATVAMPLVTELIGILINLKYARFDAENNAVVVKQSASVMVATFLGLGMVLFTVGLTIATVLMAGQIVGLLIIDAVFVIVSAFLYLAIVTKGEQKYLKLTA